LPAMRPRSTLRNMNSRSRFRNTRAAITAASSIGAKGLAGVINLVSIPLTLHYLGPERFGLWMTIASLQTIFAFADFGLGNGVLNTVAEAYGRGDLPFAFQAIRSAFALQACVAAVLLGLFWLASSYIDWPAALHVSGSVAVREARPAILIFATLFFARSVLQVIQQAQYGLQTGYIANAWTAVGNTAALIGLYVAASDHASVPILCLVVSGCPVASNLLNACWWLSTRLRSQPHRTTTLESKWHILCSMMKVGLLFFLLQVGAALYYGVDPVIVNQVLGSAAVATLAVVQKPFDMLSILLLLLMQPLWPAYREAIASGDIQWVRSTFRRALAVAGFVAVFFALLMGIEGRQLIALWAGSDVHPSEALILAYCAAHIFSATQTPLSFFLNGLGKIRFQLLLSTPVIFLSIVLKVVLTSRLGLAIIPLTTVILGTVLMLPMQVVYVRRQLRGISRYAATGAPGNPESPATA
jgi:O-antigen/teichoic acid export membrane protein